MTPLNTSRHLPFPLKKGHFLILLLLVSCNSGNRLSESALIGSWKVVECTIDSPELSSVLVEGAIAELESSIYTFQADGVLLLDAEIHDEHVQGSWSLDVDRKTLELVHQYKSAPTTEQYEVSEFEKGSLRLHQDMGEVGVMDMKLEQQ